MKRILHIANNLRETILACPKKASIYNKIKPILFDVSLRDGIQNAKVENYTTNIKMDIFYDIISEIQPQNIEIGSLTSSKILPIMNDSLVLHNYACQYMDIKQKFTENTPNHTKIYVLIPSITKLQLAFENKVRNFSFITSVSDAFQLRNTKKNLNETKQDFIDVFEMINREPGSRFFHKKLYISCINNCPISGKIDNNLIINELLYYYNEYSFDELCLSDTTGELQIEDFKYIINSCIFLGIPVDMFSLHLHYSNKNYKNIENLEQILYYSFDIGIHKFDVSCLETGGCSVTMNAENLHTNLSYDMFYSILSKYIVQKIEL